MKSTKDGFCVFSLGYRQQVKAAIPQLFIFHNFHDTQQMPLNFINQLSPNAQSSTTEVSALITTGCYQKEKPQWQLCLPNSSPTSCSQIQLKKKIKNKNVLFIWALSSLLSALSQRAQGPAQGAHDRFGQQLIPALTTEEADGSPLPPLCHLPTAEKQAV